MARKKNQKRASKQYKNRQKRSLFAYPLVIFLLLCSGVFLVAWTLKAGAADILVSAKVSAAFVTQPAEITSPGDGDHFTSIPITVAGICPANAAYVEIFSNGSMRGAAICGAGNNFSLSVDLFPEANNLTARAFNSTDDEGPVSTPLVVYYDVPQPPQPAGGGAQPSTPASSSSGPVILKTSFIYKGYHAGSQVEWPVDLSGGTAPYALSVDWGDGNTDLISRPQAGEFTISHIYSQPGDYKSSYVIKIKATDSAGKTAFIQFFVIVAPANILPAGSIFNKPIPKIGGGLNLLWIAWPLYLVIILMTLSYRLGEKEELIVLRRRGLLRR